MLTDENIKNLMNAEHYNRYQFACEFVKGRNILDVACGEGAGTYLLANFAKNVIGVDIRQDAINFADANYRKNNLSFKAADAINLPFDDNYFDAAVSFETIEHLSESDQHKFLGELRRVVRADGLVIISTPDKRSWRKMGLSWDDHLHELDQPEFKSLLEKYFSVKDYFGQGKILDDVSFLKNKFRYFLNFIKKMDYYNLRYKLVRKEFRKNIDEFTTLVNYDPGVYKLNVGQNIAITDIAVCYVKK